VTEFWARADLEDAAFRSDELRTLGLVADGRLAYSGVFRKAENLSEVECDACGDRHIEHVHAIIEPPGSRARLYIVCKESGRVLVDPERVEVQRIDFDGLARTISNLLGLSTPRVIVESRLWLLGGRKLGDRMRDIFFARGTTWPDGLSLAGQARLITSPCPVILVPNLLPEKLAWKEHGQIILSMSEFDWFGDDSHELSRKVTAVIAEHDRRPIVAEESWFHKDGETWALSFNGNAIHIRDMLGLGYIAELLRKPGFAIEAAALAGASVESTNLTQLSGIPMADKATIKAVRAELAAMTTELAGLQKSDWVRKGELKQKVSKLEKYLREVETNKGRARKVAGTAQRSRTSVTNSINRAIDRISSQHPDLGRHLKESIKTGTAPVYLSASSPEWRF